ncbi:DUF3891 family protein [Sediminibacillus albus]|uniref:DUF3891 domain-containing protein n=1 Tax=Sediminibacillus albus TaxID=407036 RepID=A0A1G9AAC8_9BACI|nr:DUF3891 family protein [Sediminibacillus albus]SDK23784.1 Protein of unknown function [Sediminibacillus albus]
MIIKKLNGKLEIIKQQDHAYLSYQIANHWNKEEFPYPELKQEVLFAIRHHDRAWLSLDRELTWNEQKNRPFDFTDYPLTEKLQAYSQGINEVEECSPYGAILCSLHYSSFFKNNQEAEAAVFWQEERKRRQRLGAEVNIHNLEAKIERHVTLLQFCDDLSLYSAMNTPGISKKNELSWFQNGFRQRFSFAPNGMEAAWLDEKQIQVQPFPFEAPFTVRLPFKQTSLNRSEAEGDWYEDKGDIRTITYTSANFS